MSKAKLLQKMMLPIIVTGMFTGVTYEGYKRSSELSKFEIAAKGLAWILHEGGIYKNKMAISLISGHGYVNFHLNYVYWTLDKLPLDLEIKFVPIKRNLH